MSIGDRSDWIRGLGIAVMVAVVVFMIYRHSVWVGSVRSGNDANATNAPVSKFQAAVAEREAVYRSNIIQRAKAYEPFTEDDLQPVRQRLQDQVDRELGYLVVGSNGVERRISPAEQMVQRAYRVQTIAENLVAPDGLAVHPLTQDIYVSEKAPGRIRLLRNEMLSHVVDRGTPVYRMQGERQQAAAPLRRPEGMAFARNGDLYVVEDVPGGRLLQFPMSGDGKYRQGKVVEVPGRWSGFAWESVDVGPRGDLLISGSDTDYKAAEKGNQLFSGAIVYRDTDGSWWVPYDRLFARFSSVLFSRSGRHAIYACELTGELGWIDLETRRPIGGMSRHIPDTPEGICALPDGTYMVAERGGSVFRINPATDQKFSVVDGIHAVESIVWDASEQRVLVSDTESGRILAIASDVPFEEGRDLFDYAIFHPNYSPQHVPEQCPDYLLSVLEKGGIEAADFDKAYVSFRDFAARVPMIAAKAKAVPVSDEYVPDDPVEEVQFVIFEPDRMLLRDDADNPTTLAAVAVRHASGEVLKTSLVKMYAHNPGQFNRLTEEALNEREIFVPRNTSLAVSMLGIAAIQFKGLGFMPDYSLVLNPWNDEESYLVAFDTDGQQYHYRLQPPDDASVSELWVLAYTHAGVEQWPLLAAAGQGDGDVQSAADVYRPSANRLEPVEEQP